MGSNRETFKFSLSPIVMLQSLIGQGSRFKIIKSEVFGNHSPRHWVRLTTRNGISATCCGPTIKNAKRNAALTLIHELSDESVKLPVHPISWLIELCQSLQWPVPDYKYKEEKTSNGTLYKVACTVQQFRAIAQDSDLRNAKYMASYKICMKYQDYLPEDMEFESITERLARVELFKSTKPRKPPPVTPEVKTAPSQEKSSTKLISGEVESPSAGLKKSSVSGSSKELPKAIKNQSDGKVAQKTKENHDENPKTLEQRNSRREYRVPLKDAERRIKQALEAKEDLPSILEEKIRKAISGNFKSNSNVQKEIKPTGTRTKMNDHFDALQRGQEKFDEFSENMIRTLKNIDKGKLHNYASFSEKVPPMVETYEKTMKSMAIALESAGEVVESLVDDFQTLQREIVTKIEVEAQGKNVQKEITVVPKPEPSHSANHPLTEDNASGTNQPAGPEAQKNATKMTDESLKIFAYNCRKIVGKLVNGITESNESNLKEIYKKLENLLSGNFVSYGDVELNATAHPLGKKFCAKLLAKNFVTKGITEVANNAKAAFPIAAVVVAVWQKFPKFGDFFLPYVYRECLYLEIKDNAQDGKTSDNSQDTQDVQLKGIAGVSRLYAAILITKPPNGEDHPHGLKNGWLWLSEVVKRVPLRGISASVLLEVLQIAGHELLQAYGQNFLKLIRVMKNEYLPKLKLVDEGELTVSLENLLDKALKGGDFDEPEGILSPNFW
ncbi:mRNA export factor Gle1-like [Lutzomyia longipalpis]|uniref:mRNA export factor Gle1-like n=1 Tax=Lutzomyia longipalpis TaxID=7200 RepID=UPI00248465B3|nr:mRNA export factor Gle1-like [Lutzomyia longipalpis]